jgi:hypothetical protein
MKTATKKNKIITDSDIDGAMMSGRGMTKTEAIKMEQWVKEQKAVIKTKQPKRRLQRTFS